MWYSDWKRSMCETGEEQQEEEREKREKNALGSKAFTETELFTLSFFVMNQFVNEMNKSITIYYTLNDLTHHQNLMSDREINRK